MRMKLITGILLFLFAACGQGPGEKPDEAVEGASPAELPEWLSDLEPVDGEFPVRANRPRLYLTSTDLPVIRARIAGTHREAWQRIQKARASSNLRERMLANAFSYMVRGDSWHARKAIEAALELAAMRDRPNSDLGNAYRVWPEAVVYDWCYGHFTPRERERLLNDVRWQLGVAGGRNLERQPPHAGHLVNHLADAHLPAGIAFYEADPEIYNRALEVLRTQIAAKNIFYRYGASSQGNSYGVTHFNGDIRMLAMLLKATDVDLFERFPFYRDVGYYWIYTRRPDGQILRNGDDWLDDSRQNARVRAGASFPVQGTAYYEPESMWTHPWLSEMLLYAAAMYRDPYLLNEYFLVRDLDLAWTAIIDILWRDPELEPRGPQSLPSVAYLGGPVGTLLFRTGWGMDDLVGMFKVMPLFAKNHDHLDRLGFQVYCRGALALDSGIYEGTNSGYDSDHWLMYFQRSIAHNTLLIRDPGETVVYRDRRVVADGGQFYPEEGANAGALTSLAEPKWRIAKVLAHETDPQERYAFVVGDATGGYGSKAEQVQRTFVFLKGMSGRAPAGSIVIHDRVRSLRPEHEKVWLLHSMEEPEVRGRSIWIRRTGGRNSGGCLVSQTLLPRKARIEKIGGPGKKFLVNDTDYPTEKGGDAEGGAWRVEVSSREESAAVEFLHALQVFPAEPPGIAEAGLITGDGLAGADLPEWTVVIFDPEKRDMSYEYVSGATGRQTHLLLGLPPERAVVVSAEAPGGFHCRNRTSRAGSLAFQADQAGETRFRVSVE